MQQESSQLLEPDPAQFRNKLSGQVRQVRDGGGGYDLVGANHDFHALRGDARGMLTFASQSRALHLGKRLPRPKYCLRQGLGPGSVVGQCQCHRGNPGGPDRRGDLLSVDDDELFRGGTQGPRTKHLH